MNFKFIMKATYVIKAYTCKSYFYAYKFFVYKFGVNILIKDISPRLLKLLSWYVKWPSRIKAWGLIWTLTLSATDFITINKVFCMEYCAVLHLNIPVYTVIRLNRTDLFRNAQSSINFFCTFLHYFVDWYRGYPCSRHTSARSPLQGRQELLQGHQALLQGRPAPLQRWPSVLQPTLP